MIAINLYSLIDNFYIRFSWFKEVYIVEIFFYGFLFFPHYISITFSC